MIFFKIFHDFSPQATSPFAAGEKNSPQAKHTHSPQAKKTRRRRNTHIRRRRRKLAARRNPLQILPVPVDGFGDAAGEVVLRVVAEEAARLADVRVGVLDVAGALRTELRRDILAERLGQHAVDVQQVLAAAVRDVERLAGRLVRSVQAFRLASTTFAT